MRRLVRYMRPYLPSVIRFAGAADGAGDYAGSRAAVDQACHRSLPGRERTRLRPPFWIGWLAPDVRTGLLQIAVLYLATILFGFLCDFGQTYLMQRTGQFAMFDLRRELMEHLQKLDVSYYDRNPVGRLITRVTTDVDALNELWASGLVTILGTCWRSCPSGRDLAMFRLSPGMTGCPVGGDASSGAWPPSDSGVACSKVIAGLGWRLRESTPICRNTSAALPCYSFSIARIGARPSSMRINRDHMEAFKDAIQAYGWFYPVVEFLSDTRRWRCCFLMEPSGIRIRRRFR